MEKRKNHERKQPWHLFTTIRHSIETFRHLTGEFHVKFHAKNVFCDERDVGFSSEIQRGIHESGDEFSWNRIS